jgi:adenosylmethionine-8-amino-7-oxononanoate aminotransferase
MTGTTNRKDATVMTSSATTTASRDIAFQLHPFTNLRKHEADGPLVITGGHGIYVQDESGREYIEALAGLWCASLGFGEERLVEAATRQMRKLPYYHQFASKAHDTAIDLAERLIGLLPVRMSKVFFNNSGSEANDTAVKLVWYYNNARGRYRKKKIISRVRGYHGITVASASLTATSICRCRRSATRIARTTIASGRQGRARRHSQPAWPTASSSKSSVRIPTRSPRSSRSRSWERAASSCPRARTSRRCRPC